MLFVDLLLNPQLLLGVLLMSGSPLYVFTVLVMLSMFNICLLGRQLVPGVLLMPDGSRQYSQGGYMRGGRSSAYQPLTAGQYSGQAACIAKELIETGECPNFFTIQISSIRMH